MESLATQRPKSKGQDNYSIGGIFEWYIVRLFNRQNFHLQEWRRSKKVENPQDLVNHSFPDLEWELVFSGTNKYRFAVECKWREKFRDGKIEWADEDQIGRYINFQKSRSITVFVVIGVGGQPG